METKLCPVAGCNQTRAQRTRGGKLAYQQFCAEHHREFQRTKMRKKSGIPIPEHAPALPNGRYIIFDLPHQMVYVVKGKQRSAQTFGKDRINPKTIEILKRKKFQVKVLQGVSE